MLSHYVMFLLAFFLPQSNEGKHPAYGSISTLQVILRGENVICKFCQMKQASPNATTMFKHILMCQKSLTDVGFSLFVFLNILHG